MSAERTGSKYQQLNDRYHGDGPTGIVVEVKLERVDFTEMGEWIAQLNDHDQAAVFDGIASRLESYGAVSRATQVAYLVSELRKSPAQASIDAFITELHDAWKEG